MVNPDFCFIVNPTARGGYAGRRWPKLQTQLAAENIAHCYHLSEHKDHSQDLVQHALQAGYQRFVVVGGDGTANEVLNGLFAASAQDRSMASLGVIPWGTGNDWASYYGYSARAEDCIRMLHAGATTQQDIGKATFSDAEGNARTRYFLNCTGTGFDSFLLAQMGNTQGSRSRYFFSILKCLRQFRATVLQLDGGGVSLRRQTLMLEICLGKYAGAGMQFAPDAIADDGLFEVLLVEEMSALQLLSSLLYLYNGKINKHKAAQHWSCRSMSVSADLAQYFHCDGELVGQLPVQIELLPLALRVLTPR